MIYGELFLSARQNAFFAVRDGKVLNFREIVLE
jgi:hypothetical protein